MLKGLANKSKYKENNNNIGNFNIEQSIPGVNKNINGPDALSYFPPGWDCYVDNDLKVNLIPSRFSACHYITNEIIIKKKIEYQNKYEIYNNNENNLNLNYNIENRICEINKNYVSMISDNIKTYCD